MHRQAAPAGEAVAALLAGVRTLTCVRPQVNPEAALLAERLPADAAAERLQASVDAPLVDVHAAARGEPFLARGTFEGFVGQVNSQVCGQVAVFGELLPALRTPELVVRFPTRQSVSSEAARRRQRLPAGRAGERRRAALPVGRLVRAQVAPRAEHLPAVRTAVGALLAVHGELVDSDAALS